MVIFFAKVNLNSKHIYDVYSGNLDMKKILDTVMYTFGSEEEYVKEIIYKDGLDINIEQIKYKVHITDKTEEYIRGYIYKNSTVRFKVFDENSEELKSRSVKSTEAVDFYFDVYNELVGYNTAQRLGYKEFLEAFEGILNKSLQKCNQEYEFTVKLYSEGLDIFEIESQLKQIYNIQTLRFKFQPPNPPDDKILRELEDIADSTIKDYKDANIATKSVIFKASKIAGININAKEIQDQLNEANSLHSGIDSSEATKNGYVEIEAIDSHGNKHTTAEKKPIKKEISNIIEFEDACRSVIRNRRPEKE